MGRAPAGLKPEADVALRIDEVVVRVVVVDAREHTSLEHVDAFIEREVWADHLPLAEVGGDGENGVLEVRRVRTCHAVDACGAVVRVQEKQPGLCVTAVSAVAVDEGKVVGVVTIEVDGEGRSGGDGLVWVHIGVDDLRVGARGQRESSARRSSVARDATGKGSSSSCHKGWR